MQKLIIPLVFRTKRRFAAGEINSKAILLLTMQSLNAALQKGLPVAYNLVTQESHDKQFVRQLQQ